MAILSDIMDDKTKFCVKSGTEFCRIHNDLLRPALFSLPGCETGTIGAQYPFMMLTLNHTPIETANGLVIHTIYKIRGTSVS